MTTLKDLWRLGAPSGPSREWAPTPSTASPQLLVAALGCAVVAAVVLWRERPAPPPVEHFELELHVVGTPDDERTLVIFSSEGRR